MQISSSLSWDSNPAYSHCKLCSQCWNHGTRPYTETNKEVRKWIWVDKWQYLESLAGETKIAAAKENFRDLYTTTRKIAGRYNKLNELTSKMNGKILTNITDHVNTLSKCWIDQFSRRAVYQLWESTWNRNEKSYSEWWESWWTTWNPIRRR